jgi:hypothetical protein
MKLWLVMAFFGLCANAAVAQQPVRSAAVGVFGKDERAQLVPAFTNAVSIYLRHYDPEIVTQEADYAKMRVDYDFDYDVELKITSNVYEVIVTLAQKTPNLAKARKQAAHLAAGVFKTMQKRMVRPG